MSSSGRLKSNASTFTRPPTSVLRPPTHHLGVNLATHGPDCMADLHAIEPASKPLPTPNVPDEAVPTVVDLPEGKGLALRFLGSVALGFMLPRGPSVFI